MPNIYAAISDQSAIYNARVAPQNRPVIDVTIQSSSNGGSQVLSSQFPGRSPIGPSATVKGLVWGDLGSYDWPAAPVGQPYAPLVFDVEHSHITILRAVLLHSGNHVTFGAGVANLAIAEQCVLIRTNGALGILREGVVYEHSGAFEFLGIITHAYGVPDLNAQGWTAVVPTGYDVMMSLSSSQ